ncbi:endonuclease-reverse transcriptase [Pseudoloma neurophilia]|uniref:Endonuclease-reverse transcriptase n=1 Tax=Pseudoloma neurophilia TaxID=146866 RepID=A0A0R0LYC5_9MICR|nr:endonuclease-reverse transcriptase [Pseudoloma neurophilia]
MKLSKYLSDDLLLCAKMSIVDNILSSRVGDSVIQTHLETGLPQGNVISPLLFNFFISDLYDYIPANNKGVLLLFADDIIFASNDLADAKSLCDIIDKYCQDNGLFINVDKSSFVRRTTILN